MDDLKTLNWIVTLTNVASAERVESIQSLWSGYGEILRVRLHDDDHAASHTAIVKHVCPPGNHDHKYGWSGNVSHQRKLKSYQNETNWYRHASDQCGDACRVPRLIAADSSNGSSSEPSWLLVLEDLDAAGFHLRSRHATDAQVDACLSWLANFHATSLHDTANEVAKPAHELHGVWPIGTYWHLATRPDELAAMEAGPLKQAATNIDARLNNARFKTLVHGDAKLANFCFSPDNQVAAVDFQYVGGGCGMKDVAYFISSCFGDEECERQEDALLGSYFDHLKTALANRSQAGSLPVDTSVDALEQEWRSLYPVAWADFYRFLAGWSPGHWKMHGYSQRQTQLALESFKS